MSSVRALCRRFKAWLLALLADEPVAPIFTAEDLNALNDIAYAAPTGGWFAWECEQYAKCPAFWFDPWRYHDTKFAYPEPTQAERKWAYSVSWDRAVATHGERLVRSHTDRLVDERAVEAALLSRQPDPVVWGMSQAVH